jgi:hypothetical protein
MRTNWFKIAIVAGLVGINAGAAQAGSDNPARGADARASVACQASVPADPSFEVGTATTTDANGVVSNAPVRTLVEGHDLTVIHVDRIEFYRIVGPSKVELIGTIERPADLTADASIGANGCS